MGAREHRFSPAALIGFLAVVVALVAVLAYLGRERSTEPTATGTPAIGGPFTLTDQNGRTVTDKDFRGSLMLVFFGYTSCPDVCPLTLSNMTEALEQMGDDAESVVPVFITIDPERDTVEKLHEYAARFHPSLVALTGTPEQVAQAADAYHVYYKRAEAGMQNETGEHAGHDMGGYAMDHTSIIFLMGRDGEYLAHFDPNTTPAQMAAGIAEHL